MQGGFDKQTNGMTDVSKADFEVAGGSGYLVCGETKVNDHGEHRGFLLAKPKVDNKTGDKTAGGGLRRTMAAL